MNVSPPEKKSSKGKFVCSCLGILLMISAVMVCLAGVLVLDPPFLRSLGIFGSKARQVYQLAPDPIASQQLSQAFDDRQIAGVSVYVIPMKDKPYQGAFIVLDTSRGYSGLNPIDQNDDVFISLLQDLTRRNREQDLRIYHVTVDYRDEAGDTVLAFTVNQKDVESYASGAISQTDFFKLVHFDLLDTLQRLGVSEFLEESQP